MLTSPHCLLGKHEKAASAGCRPFAFLHIGTICLEVRIRSAALIFLARHKTAILGATLLAGVVRQLRGTGRQSVPSRIVAVGWQVPTCGAGVDRSSSRVGEVMAHPPPGSPRFARSRRYSVVERINSSHIPRTKNGVLAGLIRDIFSNTFSYSPNRFEQTPAQRFCLRPLSERPHDSSCPGSHRHPHGGPAPRAEN